MERGGGDGGFDEWGAFGWESEGLVGEEGGGD